MYVNNVYLFKRKIHLEQKSLFEYNFLGDLISSLYLIVLKHLKKYLISLFFNLFTNRKRYVGVGGGGYFD